jgi:hypothetical protein
VLGFSFELDESQKALQDGDGQRKGLKLLVLTFGVEQNKRQAQRERAHRGYAWVVAGQCLAFLACVQGLQDGAWTGKATHTHPIHTNTAQLRQTHNPGRGSGPLEKGSLGILALPMQSASRTIIMDRGDLLN